MTNIELKVALRALEARVAALEAKPAVVVQPVEAPKETKELKETGRKMCPKCGVKPNHFFHVKTCAGKKEEQKINAEKDSPS